jgi:hypothetical protein
MTGSGRRGAVLSIGVVAALIVGMLITLGAASANATPLNPASLILTAETYYNNMLIESSDPPLRIQHVEVGLHRLVLTGGPCIYNSSGITLSAVARVEDSPRGELRSFCPPTRGARRPSDEFIRRSKLPASPSMNFQPLVEQLADEGARSAGLAPTSRGAAVSVLISVVPRRHESEAVFVYAHSSGTPGARQIKELKIHRHYRRETVREVWY